MDPQTQAILNEAASRFGTPAYVYFVDGVFTQIRQLREVFENRFSISYAVKSNPNLALLARMQHCVATLDVSSIGEVERALQVGCPARRLTFSGPAKRMFELERAVEVGVGEMVCESQEEIEILDQLTQTAGKRMSVLPRINPKTMPRNFGLSMSGRPSQFGIDEEHLDDVLAQRDRWKNLDFAGFHIYSATNSLDEEAITENIAQCIELFTRFSESHDITPQKLIFGSGFGIPHLPEEGPLDTQKLAEAINPRIDAMRTNPRLAGAECVLEMGRFLVGPNGYLLTSVVREKSSRGTEIRMCDAGFNNHIVACGMMGTLLRRDWRFSKVNGSANEPTQKYLLTGPLCTTLDTLAMQVELPTLEAGDVLAVGMSGAYGPTCSPTRFISHPEPRELIVAGSGREIKILDVTESRPPVLLPLPETEISDTNNYEQRPLASL